MKEIKAIVQPARVARIREAMRRIDHFPGMTVSRAEGCSGTNVAPPQAGIRAELSDFSAKVRIEIVAPDELVDAIVGAIIGASSTGLRGDGLVWVTAVESMDRIQEGGVRKQRPG